MKLQQGQVWRVGDEFVRIVHLERMSVDYKRMADLTTREGEHRHATKKEFCRLIKGGTPVTGPTSVPPATPPTPPDPTS